MQIAARLNCPVQAVTCHGRMEFGSLVGQFVLTNGATQFVYGPLANAVKFGHLLILNESDRMDPAELAALGGDPLWNPGPRPGAREGAGGTPAKEGRPPGMAFS
jgi:hypothetical protein